MDRPGVLGASFLPFTQEIVRFFVVTRSGSVNRHACEVLGYSREELLGMTVSEIAVDPEAPGLYEAIG